MLLGVPFPPGYQPTEPDAPLARALADARWIVDNAQSTLHATHTQIVDGVAGGLAWDLLESAADAALDARTDLTAAAEIIDEVGAATYNPDIDGHAGAVSDRDRNALERGRELAWTAHLAGAAIIDRLSEAADQLQDRAVFGTG